MFLLQRKPRIVINKKLNSYFVKFWDKSNDLSQFSFLEKIFFFFLVVLEQIYSFAFYIVLLFRKKRTNKKKYEFKIFSVGNISVGGTGKSIFVKFLIEKLSFLRGAVVLRGYKSKAEKTGRSFLVSDGSKILLDSNFSGDEAFMISKQLAVPVVIGADRFLSCSILENRFHDLDYVVLDDAYQNFKLYKDYEILLLDATKPFENGHCLPAGKLREKDYTRADAIVLTHADSVSELEIDNMKDTLSNKFDRNCIFSGEHKFDGIFLNDALGVNIEDIKNKTVLAFAGIGSFSSFEKTVENLGFKGFLLKEYPDHYKYTEKDLDEILNLNLVDIILTTQKDWVKIFPLLKNRKHLPIYVLRVGFGFLREEEDIKFFNELKGKFN